jgi:hypothetical protein
MDAQTRKAFDDAERFVRDGSLARERGQEIRERVRSLSPERQIAERASREAKIRDLEIRGSLLRARLDREMLSFIFG